MQAWPHGSARAIVSERPPVSAATGFALTAVIRIRPGLGQLRAVGELARQTREIVECHRITGDDCHIATAHLRSVEHLEKVIDRFARKRELKRFRPSGCDTPLMMNVSSRLRPTHLLPAIAIVVASCAGGNARPSPSVEVSPASTSHASISPGDPDTAALRLESFAEGLASPTFLTHAGDGSGLLYVVEQEGRIRTVDPNGTVGEAPFLDIADRIVAGGEQGLLGLAFHPDYPDDGRFFVMYTAVDDGANTISEFTTADGTADPASERIILAIPDFAGNHNGGMVAFGPDRYLYAGTGDGGGGGDPQDNGQDPFALLGKMLRIDVDGSPEGDTPYSIPADNPFADGADGAAAAPEVWAIGLRNPWRFTFDLETGDLWIADVGQGQWEEVNAEPAGQGGRNYGWNTMEGPDCFEAESCDQTGLTLPVTAYEHGQGDCTVVGGYVYRGEAYPELQGQYLYGDFCSGRLWSLDAAAAISDGTAQPIDLVQAGISLSSFGQDEVGELYAVDLGGAIHRLVTP